MANGFLAKIKYSSNLILENLNQIIVSGKKIGVYGNGIYASRLAEALQSWSVFVDFYVVDDAYYVQSMDRNVMKLSNLDKSTDAIIIIGFETLIGKEDFLIQKKRKLLQQAPNVEIMDFEHCYLKADLISYDYILEHHKDFQTTYELLEDELSKKVLIEYLNTCISGRSENLCLLNQDNIHDYDYDLFLEEDEKEGAIVECGAFDGKTAIEMAEYLKSHNKKNTILALEPDEVNYEILCEKIKKYDRIIPVKKGVSQKDGSLFFSDHRGSGSTIIESNEEAQKFNCTRIDVCSIDSLRKEYGHVFAVTMDIEGSELDALLGSEKAIEDCRPKFAVRVYHKKEDLFTIPQFFSQLKMEKKYKLYLRKSQNTRGPLDVTLYAV